MTPSHLPFHFNHLDPMPPESACVTFFHDIESLYCRLGDGDTAHP